MAFDLRKFEGCLENASDAVEYPVFLDGVGKALEYVAESEVDNGDPKAFAKLKKEFKDVDFGDITSCKKCLKQFIKCVRGSGLMRGEDGSEWKKSVSLAEECFKGVDKWLEAIRNRVEHDIGVVASDLKDAYNELKGGSLESGFKCVAGAVRMLSAVCHDSISFFGKCDNRGLYGWYKKYGGEFLNVGAKNIEECEALGAIADISKYAKRSWFKSSRLSKLSKEADEVVKLYNAKKKEREKKEKNKGSK